MKRGHRLKDGQIRALAAPGVVLLHPGDENNLILAAVASFEAISNNSR
jgi:hypothetical protein